MKKLIYLSSLLTLIFLVLGSESHAQITTPDTVCAGASGKSYKVNGTAGSTYSWVVAGGTQVSGSNTDSIVIDWSSTPGVDTLKVVEFNVIGCPGDTISLPIVRLAPPSVSLSGTDSICLNSQTTGSPLEFVLTGLGPWTVEYTEDGTARTASNITSSPFNFDSQVFTTSGVKNYAITGVTSYKGCTGNHSGSAAVTVFPKPSTSPIAHY